ncbi:dna damage-inducible protein 1-like [Nannochloropsis oceanica]
MRREKGEEGEEEEERRQIEELGDGETAGADCTYASFRAQIRREVEEESRKEEERELKRTRAAYFSHLAEERRQRTAASNRREGGEGGERVGEGMGLGGGGYGRGGEVGEEEEDVASPRFVRRNSGSRGGGGALTEQEETEGSLPAYSLSSSSSSTPPSSIPLVRRAVRKEKGGGREEGKEGEVNATATAGVGARQSVVHMQVHKELHHQQQMLYVDCTINNRRLRACVDTGASTTVMSLAMARECGLLSHIDTSVVGGVKGVGFAKILGCVHEAKILLGRFQIQTRVSIIDSLSPPFVIGLDVLRHCQCVISFQDKVLVLRSLGGAVEKSREEIVPFSISAVPPQVFGKADGREKGEEGGGGGGAGAAEEEEEPLGSLPPSRGGVSMAGI